MERNKKFDDAIVSLSKIFDSVRSEVIRLERGHAVTRETQRTVEALEKTEQNLLSGIKEAQAELDRLKGEIVEKSEELQQVITKLENAQQTMRNILGVSA